MWKQRIVLFQFLVILVTLKALLKSQPAIRTPINLLALTLFLLINRKVSNTLVQSKKFSSQDDSHMKKFFEKVQPRVVNYRDYKYFENDRFITDLLSELGKANLEKKENGLNNLFNACKRILDIHVSRKQKYARDNHMPFMNKALCKEIMTRTRL